MLRRVIVTNLIVVAASSMGCQLIADFEKEGAAETNGGGKANRGGNTSLAGNATKQASVGGAATGSNAKAQSTITSSGGATSSGASNSVGGSNGGASTVDTATTASAGGVGGTSMEPLASNGGLGGIDTTVVTVGGATTTTPVVPNGGATSPATTSDATGGTPAATTTSTATVTTTGGTGPATGGAATGGAAQGCSAETYDHDSNPATACVAWTTCVAGRYVATNGSPTSNRVCADCAAGTFSTTNNAASCKAWTVCAWDQIQSSAGTATQDRGCTGTGGNAVRQFGTLWNDKVFDIAVDPAGNVYVVGRTEASQDGTHAGVYSAFVRKFDTSGKEVSGWFKVFGSDQADVEARSVVADSSGNIYVAGFTGGPLSGKLTSGGLDAFVRKYDSGGNSPWTLLYGSTEADYAYGVDLDPSGYLYVTGTTQGAILPNVMGAGTSNAFLSRVDTNGNLLWTKQFGGGGTNGGTGVSSDSNGNAYLAGYSNGDLMVAKYDRNGSQLWLKQYGTSSNSESVNGIVVDSAGNAYLAGYTFGRFDGNSTNNADAFVSKFSGAGIHQWNRQFGAPVYDAASGITLDNNGMPCAVGYTEGSLFGANPDEGSPNTFVWCVADGTSTPILSRQFVTSGAASESTSIARGPHGLLLAGITYGAFPGFTKTSYNYDSFIMLVR